METDYREGLESGGSQGAGSLTLSQPEGSQAEGLQSQPEVSQAEGLQSQPTGSQAESVLSYATCDCTTTSWVGHRVTLFVYLNIPEYPMYNL